MDKEFDEVFDIMKKSFPKEEMRTYEGQKKLLDKEEYRLIVKKDEKENVVSFMTLWEFENFSFIEHLATSENVRGLGIGSSFLKEYTNSTNKDIILEVEPPLTSITKRRVNFYKRSGFYLNDYYHIQPPLQKGTSPCKLQIMSYPKKLDKATFLKYKKVIYNKVYTDC